MSGSNSRAVIGIINRRSLLRMHSDLQRISPGVWQLEDGKHAFVLCEEYWLVMSALSHSGGLASLTTSCRTSLRAFA